LQKNQAGCVLFTVSEYEGTLVALAVTGWKSESVPPDMGWHGAANVDCVTVWFLGLKTNVIVSPVEALTLEGV
jgi:hypothetical protein